MLTWAICIAAPLTFLVIAPLEWMATSNSGAAGVALIGIFLMFPLLTLKFWLWGKLGLFLWRTVRRVRLVQG